MNAHSQQQTTPTEAQARQVPLKPDPHSGDLGPQKNERGEANRSLITERSMAGMAVRALLRSVQYGTNVHGKPLCLIALEVLFIFDSSMLRFKSADVVVSFAQTPDDLITGSQPNPMLTPLSVQNFCPRRVYGLPSTEEHKWIYQVDLLANLVFPPVETGITSSIARENSFTRDHRMEIRGLPIENNTVKWSLFENAKQKKGIPDRFTCAMLLEHSGAPFQAEVKISVRASMGVISLPFTFNAQPWSKDDPVIFRPGKEFAAKVPHRHLHEMKEADWLLLVDLPKEYDNEITYK